MSAFALSPANIPPEAIEALAEDTARAADAYSEQGRLDTERLLKGLGGTAVVAHDPMLAASRLVITGPESFYVTLPSNTSTTLDRFLVAREVGHLKLHLTNEDGTYKPMCRREVGILVPPGRRGETRARQEANEFAIAALLPRTEFIQAREGLADDRTRSLRLMDIFAVPEWAVTARQEGLLAAEAL